MRHITPMSDPDNYYKLPWKDKIQEWFNDSAVERLMKHPKDYIIAGGAIIDTILGRTPKDINVFATPINIDLLRVKTERTPVEINYIKVSPPLDPQKLFDTFDLRVCCLGIYGDGSIVSSSYDTGAVMDLAHQRLFVKGSLFRSSTLERLVKYGRKGFFLYMPEVSCNNFLSISLRSCLSGGPYGSLG